VSTTDVTVFVLTSVLGVAADELVISGWELGVEVALLPIALSELTSPFKGVGGEVTFVLLTADEAEEVDVMILPFRRDTFSGT
jgi:hypothetical protein